jgi:hypothetical protein
MDVTDPSPIIQGFTSGSLVGYSSRNQGRDEGNEITDALSEPGPQFSPVIEICLLKLPVPARFIVFSSLFSVTVTHHNNI